MGAWIETHDAQRVGVSAGVAPVWVRGLKLVVHRGLCLLPRRTRMGAWIETQIHQSDAMQSVSHPYGCVD